MPPGGLSLAEARGVALAAQGFDRPLPRRVGNREVRECIRRLGLLQIDYANNLAPAQYQVLYSRLGPYDRRRLDELVYSGGEFTERWAHEASIVPVDSWPLLRHRMDTHRVRPWGFEKVLERHADFAAGVLEEVRRRGPLSADDLSVPDGIERRVPHSWFGSVTRCILEAHFGRGALAVVDRRSNGARLYDVAERVIPLQHCERRLDREEAQREMLRIAARAHGVASVRDLADYWRMPVREARPLLVELAGAGELQEIRVEGWREPAYLHPAARVSNRIERAALLCPFDPLIWTRERAARLFGFEYRVEIFVPPEKRKWGYYVLPFLFGDRLAARVDLKADRSRDCLCAPAAYIEERQDAGAVADALAAELRVFAGWLGLERIEVGQRGNFARRLAAAVKKRI